MMAEDSTRTWVVDLVLHLTADRCNSRDDGDSADRGLAKIP